MKSLYIVVDRKGIKTTKGYFSEAEVRMAAKAGMRVFKIGVNEETSEITQSLTGLFNNKFYG